MNDIFILPLTNNHRAICLINVEDAEYIMTFKWRVDAQGYIIRSDGVKKFSSNRLNKLHHYLMHASFIDHKNHNLFDNRRVNLRYATRSQNGANQIKQKRKTSSIYKGVCWHKQREKWAAVITKNKKKNNIGVYNTQEEAALAYNRKAVELFGEFAYLNVVKKGDDNI